MCDSFALKIHRFNLVEFQKDVLKIHNSYRNLHAAKPLKLNFKLTMKAQEWADVS